MTLSILCNLGKTRKAFSTREGFLKRSEHSPCDLLSAWLTTYLLFDFCKGFDCDTQEINGLHLARKKEKCQIQAQGVGVCLFVCCFVLFKVSKHSITRDLEAPSANTGTILFPIPVGGKQQTVGWGYQPQHCSPSARQLTVTSVLLCPGTSATSPPQDGLQHSLEFCGCSTRCEQHQLRGALTKLTIWWQWCLKDPRGGLARPNLSAFVLTAGTSAFWE